MSHLARWAAYPLVTGSALLFCWQMLAREWPAWAIGAVVVVASAVVVQLLEWWIPYTEQWSSSSIRTDVWHNLVSSRACDVGSFVAITVFAPLGVALADHLGVAVWPHHWPLALQGLLAIALVELPWYWCHRLEHEWPLLWRVHAVHHSSEHLTWWNLARSHPIDNAVSAFASVALIALLGPGTAPLAIAAAFGAAHGMLQHANVDLRTGPLDVVLNTARVHRWHHSRVPEQSNANYGPTLTLWDFVFGTRRFDARAIPPLDVGLHRERPFPSDYAGQLLAPFDRELWRNP